MAPAGEFVRDSALLTDLDLHDTHLGDYAGSAICASATQSCSLTSLNLSRNSLGEEAAEQIGVVTLGALLLS